MARAHHKSVEPQFSDVALLDDLARCWGLAGTERLSVAQYRAHGGVHSVSTFITRFGSWAMATALAQEQPATAQRGQKQRRSCLRCERLFVSGGKAHRLCGPCRDRLAAEATPAVIHPLQTGWQRDGWRV